MNQSGANDGDDYVAAAWRRVEPYDDSDFADFSTLLNDYLYLGARHGDRDCLAQVLQGWNPQVDKYNDISPALFEAIYRGDDVAVQMLIDAGVSLKTNEPCDPHFTPLLVASQYGRLEIARRFWELLGPEARFNSAWRHSSAGRPYLKILKLTSLEVAAHNGQAELVTFFLEAFDGWTADEKAHALTGAAGQRWDDCVAVLLERLTYEPHILQSALEAAVYRRRILGEDPTDFLRRRRLGSTTVDGMEVDERHRQRRIICDLIDAGADPEGHDKWSLLRCAIMQDDYIASVGALVEKGANADARDSDGGTALHALLRKGSPAHKVWGCQDSNQDRMDALQLLLEHGASPDAADQDGETPLQLAAGNGTLEQLQLCLAHSSLADALAAPNARGESPLHYAAASGRDEIFEYLLAQEAVDVNLTSCTRWTPLLCALSPAQGKLEETAFRMATRLLARGARAQTVTAEGWSPLHAVAAWRSQAPDMRSLNERYGYDPAAREHLVRLAHELIRRGASLEAEPAFLRDPTVTPDRVRGVWGLRMQVLAAESLGQEGDVVTGGIHSASGTDTDTTPLAWAIRTGAMDLVEIFLEYLKVIAEDGQN